MQEATSVYPTPTLSELESLGGDVRALSELARSSPKALGAQLKSLGIRKLGERVRLAQHLAEHVDEADAAGSRPPRLTGWEAVSAVLRDTAPPIGSDAHTLWRSRTCVAASVASALELLEESRPRQAGRGQGGRQLLWLVGSREAMEGELVRGGHLAQPLARLWARADGLEIHLIGPEMKQWSLSLPSDGASPPTLVTAVPGTLHEADAREPPNAAVLLNSGVGTLLWPLVEPWLPTLALLLRLRCPTLLTCFNSHEAEGEAQVLRPLGANLILPSRRNALSFPTPLAAVRHAADADEAEALRLVQQAVAAADDDEAHEEAYRAEVEAAESQSNGEVAAAVARAARSGMDRTRQPTTPSRYIKWVEGSSLDGDTLSTSAVADASDMTRQCAKLFALTNMRAWVDGLTTGEACAPSVDGEVGGGESVACYAMLLAEAVDDTAIALLAHQQHGAAEALQQALSTWAPRAPDALRAAAERRDAAPPRLDGSYCGTDPAARIVTACFTALKRLQAAARAALALQTDPDADEAALAGGRAAYRNAFGGEFINLREAPRVNSAVVAKLTPGETCVAVAVRGGWVRVVEPVAGWGLLEHPTWGTLLEPVDE